MQVVGNNVIIGSTSIASANIKRVYSEPKDDRTSIVKVETFDKQTISFEEPTIQANDTVHNFMAVIQYYND